MLSDLRVGMEEYVGVSIYQAREDHLASKVDIVRLYFGISTLPLGDVDYESGIGIHLDRDIVEKFELLRVEEHRRVDVKLGHDQFEL